MHSTGQIRYSGAMSKDNWGEGGVYKRGRIWWIFYPRHGETVRESSKSQKESDAHKLRRKRLLEVAAGSGLRVGPKIDRITVGDLLDDLLADYEMHGKTVWWAKLNVENHLRPFFKYIKAVRLTTEQVREYRKQKRELGLSDSTINRHLALLRRAFKLGTKANPPKVALVPAFELVNEDKNARQGFLEHDDFLRLRAALPEELRPIATFAYYTGCRKGEILGLRWSQVDLKARIIRLLRGHTKNKEPRMIPLAGEVFEAIQALKQERDELWPWSEWVFSRQGSPIRSIYTAWRSACERAGVKGSLLHDMRRTGVRNLVRANVPERVAMQISGHKTRAVFDRYNIVSEEDLLEAASKLDKHLSGKREK